MRYHQIPSIVEDIQNVALNVIAWTFCGKQVAAPSLMPSRRKSVSNNSRKFARY
jgi:hypothetical protein